MRRKPSLKEEHSSEGRGRSAVLLIIPLPRAASYRLWYYLQDAILGILRKSYLDIEKCALGQDSEIYNLKKKKKNQREKTAMKSLDPIFQASCRKTASILRHISQHI